MKQLELIQPEHVPTRLRWEQLFQFLPDWPQPAPQTGRPPVNRLCLLKAFIYQRLTRKRFLRDLHSHLMDNPATDAALGFDPYQPPPSLERFSAFLCDCPHPFLQDIRIALTRSLIQLGLIHGRHVGFDSCPIASWVRENNLKTSCAMPVRQKLSTQRRPRCTLGRPHSLPQPWRNSDRILLGLSQPHLGRP